MDIDLFEKIYDRALLDRIRTAGVYYGEKYSQKTVAYCLIFTSTWMGIERNLGKFTPGAIVKRFARACPTEATLKKREIVTRQRLSIKAYRASCRCASLVFKMRWIWGMASSCLPSVSTRVYLRYPKQVFLRILR